MHADNTQTALNEDDTFNKLRRTPASSMYNMLVLQPNITYEYIAEQLSNNGWTVEDFIAERRAMIKAEELQSV